MEKLSGEEATEYFHARPLSSQIGAAISPQSQLKSVPGREYLNKREAELSAKVGVGENKLKIVDKPEHWWDKH